MKKTIVLLACLGLILFLPGCLEDTTTEIDDGLPDTSDSSDSSDSGSSSDQIAAIDDGAGIIITATVSNLAIADAVAGALAGALAGFKMDTDPASGNQANIQPRTYKMAMVNFWLRNEDDEYVSVINPDEDNPDYTDEQPLIIDFTEDGGTVALFATDTLAAGTYLGWKMQFLYIEMELPCVFHIPLYPASD